MQNIMKISMLASALIAGAAILNGCTEKETSVSAQTSLRPIATIQDIMQAVVDPAADSLWDAVSTTITLAGTEEKQPRTDEEWAAVRHQAILLVESANLLATPGRIVSTHGILEDAHVQGINTPDEIKKLIDSDFAQFTGYARALQETANAALVAIDKRDIPALIEAGGHLDHACEQCHLHYWYPNAQKVPE